MLYLVPTPIGNLEDITLRALQVLKTVDRIACEDTRHTLKLLNHFQIQKPLISFHDHTNPAKVKELIKQLEEGGTLALVSDAGTPLLADPGFPLVREAIQKGIKVESLPGAFAASVALSASGLPAESFAFFGFLPQKSAARKKRLASLKDREETLIFYESPYRVLTVLKEMAEIFPDREAVVARELTKKFEEYARGTLPALAKTFGSRKILGEIVILVSGSGRKRVFES